MRIFRDIKMKNSICTKRHSANNRGFTLIELLVVLVLMSILLGTTLVAGLGWQDWSQFRHEETVAEEIFYAAQNQLAEMDASGALDYKISPVIDQMKADTTTNKNLYPPINNVVYKKNGTADVTYDLSNIWINSNPDESGSIVMLRADAGDYDSYTKGTLIGNDKKERSFFLIL